MKLNIQKAPFLQYAAKVFNDAATKAGNFDVVVMETNRMATSTTPGTSRTCPPTSRSTTPT